jgi:hypothetical protein
MLSVPSDGMSRKACQQVRRWGSQLSWPRRHPLPLVARCAPGEECFRTPRLRRGVAARQQTGRGTLPARASPVKHALLAKEAWLDCAADLMRVRVACCGLTSFARAGQSTASGASRPLSRAKASTGDGCATALLPRPRGFPGCETTSATCWEAATGHRAAAARRTAAARSLWRSGGAAVPEEQGHTSMLHRPYLELGVRLLGRCKEIL